jgi:hypothetical protein
MPTPAFSQDVPAKFGGTPPKTKAGLVRRLYQHRKRFAQIAAFKCDEGDYRLEVRHYSGRSHLGTACAFQARCRPSTGLSVRLIGLSGS